VKRSRHHWHVIVDVDGKPTGAVIEHEHQVNPDRRHAHYYSFDSALASLREQGLGEAPAWRLAMRLDGRPEGTLDLERAPTPALDEQLVAATLHPEVRRSLT